MREGGGAVRRGRVVLDCAGPVGDTVVLEGVAPVMAPGRHFD